jgi:thiol-disulfide isomerase/thioredoxin
MNMKYRVAVMSVFMIVILGVAIFYVMTAPTAKVPSVTPSPSSSASPSSTPVVNASDLPARAGTYINYSSDVIATTPGTKLLFFHAPWCPQCRALDKDISATTIPENTTIIKVDYDSNQALRQKYGITIQTTLVRVDDGGELVKKYVAYNHPTFTAVKQNLLD